MQTELLLLSHRKLRTLLIETGLQLLHISFENASATKAMLKQVNKCLELCIACCAETEQHLFPLVAPYEPSLVDTLQQYQRILGISDLAFRISELNTATNARERKEAGTQLAGAFETLVFAQMQLLRSLQKGLLPVLYHYYPIQMLQEIGENMHRDPHNKTRAAAHSEDAGFRKQLYGAELALANSLLIDKPEYAAAFGC